MNVLCKELPYTVLLDRLILVTPQDEFVSPVDKWQAHSNNYLEKESALPHRAFSIFLFNERNQLLMQRRSVDKQTFPLCWTNTCCSHPNMVELQNKQLAEEPVRAALNRALRRELTLDLSHSIFYYKNKIVYKQKGKGQKDVFGEFQVDYVYLNKVATHELKYSPVKEEIAELKWVNRGEMPAFIDQVTEKGGYFSPWFLKMQNSGLLNEWWEEVEQNNLHDSPGEHKKNVLNLL